MSQSDVAAPTGHDPAVERRQGVRYMTVMRVATLQTEQGEELCLVRNISEGGLKARIWSNLDVGAPLVARFKSDYDLPGTVVWRRDDHIGVQFRAPADVPLILSGDETPAPGFRPRPPRIILEAPARLRVGARDHRVTLRDISQGGVKVRLDAPDQWDEAEPPIVLLLAGLPATEGGQRWRDGEIVGIAFNTPIPLDALARWLIARRG
jgi:hypothetical protein